MERKADEETRGRFWREPISERPNLTARVATVVVDQRILAEIRQQAPWLLADGTQAVRHDTPPGQQSLNGDGALEIVVLVVKTTDRCHHEFAGLPRITWWHRPDLIDLRAVGVIGMGIGFDVVCSTVGVSEHHLCTAGDRDAPRC